MNHLHNLFFAITTFCTISSTNFVSAQIVPDNTLPNNSQIKVEGNITKIEGGTTAGSNLFHSFEKFGISTGNEAHFNNAVDINNIITRVTGKSFSDIDGLIKANGTANLFLINPNGIVFGENARLDIGGSFVGSTADSFQFGNNVEFSVVNPDSKPLLSVNVPLGLQYGKNAGEIQVKGDRQGIRTSSEVIDTQNGLRVKPNQTLALIGGDINLEEATLKTGGGRIELGSVAAPGLVNIASVEKGFSFDYDSVEGGNIELSQQTTVDASGEGAGDIRLWGRNIKITDGSLIGTVTGRFEDGGSLVVNGQESVEVIGNPDGQFTGLLTGVSSQATGKGADITIKTNNLLVKDAAGLLAFAEENSTGDVGDITIQTNSLLVEDGAAIDTLTSGEGNGGDITIKANTLLIKNEASVSAATFAQGNGGNLSINAQDVQIGRLSNLSTFATDKSTGDVGDLTIKTNNLLVKNEAYIYTSTLGQGKGGDLTIETNNLLVKDGASVYANTFGQGNGGNLSINAQDVQLTGRLSGLDTSSGQESTGDAGDLTIKTNNLLVKHEASIRTDTLGEGNAGNLNINAVDIQLIGETKDGQLITGLSADSASNLKGEAGDITIKTNNLLVKDGARVDTSTSGQGKGGNLNVDAQNVQIVGTSKDGQFPSWLSTDAQPNSTGNAGNLTIKTNNLLVKDGARVDTSTSGQGKGGNLNVDAQNVQIVGESFDGQFSSSLIASAVLNSTGDAGNLTIKTNNLLVKDGAQIQAATFGQGKGGNLTVDAKNVQLIGKTRDNRFSSGLFTSAVLNSTGDAGNLIINADILQVEDGAKVSVESLSTGTAGKLTINTDSIRLNNDALISANTRNNTKSDTEQATINIKTQELIMRRGSNIFTNATGENVIGGNINIDTNLLIANENSDISANSENSRGGNVRIDAKSGVFGTQFRSQPTPQSDITATGATENSSGTVEIITPQSDINSGLVELPTIPVETEIADVCSTPGYAQSSFTITGKGSLPPSPFKPLVGRLNRTKLATLDEVGETKVQARRIRKVPQIKQIVEAKGWVRTPDGKIILVPYAPDGNFYSPTVSKSCSYKNS